MSAQKTALITGVSGQDGAYLAQFLLGKGYAVHGFDRWESVAEDSALAQRFRALDLDIGAVRLHHGDIMDAHSVMRVVQAARPDEVYNLAALSHVAVSFDAPSAALDINARGTLNVLEAVRLLGMAGGVRVYQASSSEMFGCVPAPQNEDTPMMPCSPYGVSKLAGYHLARVYREAYGLQVSNGILFNHESPLRGQDFVTRKISRAVAEIESGARSEVLLGNLGSQRDWGHARDYAAGMWMMLQQERADDFVLASGQVHSVRDFVERAFSQIGVRIEWRGAGIDEVGVDVKTGHILVRVDEALFRTNDVHHILGDASKAREILGWIPDIDFDALVSEMVNADRKQLWADQKVERLA